MKKVIIFLWYRKVCSCGAQVKHFPIPLRKSPVCRQAGLKLSPKAIFLIILLSLFFNFCIAADEPVKIHNTEGWKWSIPFGKTYNYTDILVERAVDGDTLKLENGERVRLIGIDTPEIHESNKLYKDSQRSGQDATAIQKLGRRAYEFTRKLVEGKRVSLEFDVEKYDKYNRLLAYVYLKDGRTFVNAEIVKEGYASLMSIPPNVKYADLFVKLYQEARENRRGLWSKN